MGLLLLRLLWPPLESPVGTGCRRRRGPIPSLRRRRSLSGPPCLMKATVVHRPGTPVCEHLVAIRTRVVPWSAGRHPRWWLYSRGPSRRRRSLLHGSPLWCRQTGIDRLHSTRPARTACWHRTAPTGSVGSRPASLARRRMIAPTSRVVGDRTATIGRTLESGPAVVSFLCWITPASSVGVQTPRG